jgi:hypothetical protein
MSLINDALKRASQTQKDRPHQASTPIGMEAVPVSNKSPVTGILLAVVVIALGLAGWFFHEWWVMRNHAVHGPVVANVATPAPVQPSFVPAPAPAPKPVPAPVVPVVVAAKPAPAPAPAPVLTAPPLAQPIPAAPPVAVNESLAVWPTDIKVSAIFFSRTNPRVMISGNIYGVGDDIEGMTVKRIGKDKVVLELNGHTKEYFLEGQ